MIVKTQIFHKHNITLTGPCTKIKERIQKQIQKFLKESNITVNNKLRPIKLSKYYYDIHYIIVKSNKKYIINILIKNIKINVIINYITITIIIYYNN